MAKSATGTVPIVAAGVNDPVAMGLAQSLARPGGNITGISSWGLELVAKRLQLLKDLVPGARQPSRHAGAHPPQARDPDLHLSTPPSLLRPR